jgi:Rps23 Pro-64 3,4-dihydroxylase Tpa1-like proline 4-hydroxylase
MPCHGLELNLRLRHLILNVFTSILRNYRNFVTWQETGLNSDTYCRKVGTPLASVFNVKDFLLDLDIESRAFMDFVLQTQSFYEFIAACASKSAINYEILFFDESVKAKVNRSCLQLQKQCTSFLEDKSYDVHITIHVAGAYFLKQKGLTLGRS